MTDTAKLAICARLRNSGWISQNTNAESELPYEAAALIETLVGALDNIAEGRINTDFVESQPPNWSRAFGDLQSIARAALAIARQANDEPPLSPYPEIGSGNE